MMLRPSFMKMLLSAQKQTGGAHSHIIPVNYVQKKIKDNVNFLLSK
jgi:hypothetical protein